MAFVCAACGDSNNSKPYVVGQVQSYCRGCALRGILPIFEMALKTETEYPPRLGVFELNINDYEGLLPPGFRAQWDTRMQEYSVLPASSRLYCPNKVSKTTRRSVASARGNVNEDALELCGAFVAPNDETIRQCATCTGYSCYECRAAVNRGAVSTHACKKTEAADPFEGMTLGKDYQICPNEMCGYKSQLIDGCNLVTCRCGCHFCFVCGKDVTANENHWAQGGSCPRWGQPGAENAMFDVPAPDLQQEIEEDEEELRQEAERLRQEEERLRQEEEEIAQEEEELAQLRLRLAAAEEELGALRDEARDLIDE